MYNILNMIMFEFAHNDDYLTGTFAHANKHEARDMKVPTRLRGDRLEYNSQLLKDMDKNRATQFAGELVHLALSHPDRMQALVGTADHLRPVADIAFQLATHHTLEHENRPVDEKIFLKPSMIKGPDDKPLPDFKSAEEYFAMLVQRVNQENIPIPGPDDSEGDGEGEGQGKGEKLSDFQQMAKNLGVPQTIQDQDTSTWGSVPKSLQDYHKILMKQDLQKLRGNLPAGLERILDELETEEQEDWKRLIDRMVGSKFAIRRYKGTYKRPNRRYGIGFLGKKRLKRGALVYVIDSSGSMPDHSLAVCVSNGKHIAKRYGAPFLCLVADAAVHTVKMIKTMTDLNELEVVGGGGTMSEPVFDYLRDNNVKTDLLVYITDLMISFPEHQPQEIRQVVWAVVDNPDTEKPPFGDMIHINIPEVNA